MFCVCESIPDFFCDCVAIYMHSYVSYMYHYVCVFQSWLVTEKREGRSGGKSKEEVFVYRCICVFPSFVLCMYTLFDPSLFFFCFFTYIHIYTYTCIQTYIRTYIRVYVYGCMYTYVRSYVHTRVVSQKYIKESVYVYIYMCIYIYNVYIVVSIHSRLILKLCGKRVFFFLLSLNYYIFTHIHTYIHAYIYTYIQTYIHTSTHAYAFMYRICTKCLIEIFYIVSRKRRHSR